MLSRQTCLALAHCGSCLKGLDILRKSGTRELHVLLGLRFWFWSAARPPAGSIAEFAPPTPSGRGCRERKSHRSPLPCMGGSAPLIICPSPIAFAICHLPFCPVPFAIGLTMALFTAASSIAAQAPRKSHPTHAPDPCPRPRPERAEQAILAAATAPLAPVTPIGTSICEVFCAVQFNEEVSLFIEEGHFHHTSTPRPTEFHAAGSIAVVPSWSSNWRKLTQLDVRIAPPQCPPDDQFRQAAQIRA